MIYREYYEEPVPVPLPLRGLALRRHVWAINIQRFGCWVRGWHHMTWEPAWKDWVCLHCWYIDEHRPAPELEESQS